jgi:hypothetical protein
VELVLAKPERFADLFRCYESEDEIVRLRTSNAMKRIESERHDLLVPYIDQFINEIGQINQASAQWTLAQLFERLSPKLSEEQRNSAVALMKRNLEVHDDWIVLNATKETLSNWAKSDASLRNWLRPHLERLSRDSRKSVARRIEQPVVWKFPDGVIMHPDIPI